MNNQFGLNQDYIEDIELELELFKKTIDLNYNKISYKFGTTNRLSPKKLEIYNQYHLYNKLYKNEKQRKSIQQKAQTICPLTARNFMDNNGKFINFSKNKVYDKIKGKHYIMQLGRIPGSSRSKSSTYKSQSCQYTQQSFYQGIRMQNMKISTSPMSENKTCEQIQKACSDQLKEQKELKGIFKTLQNWNTNQYEYNLKKRPQKIKNKETIIQ
ncbi:unnamed protein product [Paramecium sonneborni]|uniref:Uncharacterized protein n=1 Tax=Paramecium sonneborni TaxID=65129 RepID=A0A8S1KJE2_9CILI|nr:unnamed protein product [Paramecium sonneborni]